MSTRFGDWIGEKHSDHGRPWGCPQLAPIFIDSTQTTRQLIDEKCKEKLKIKTNYARN